MLFIDKRVWSRVGAWTLCAAICVCGVLENRLIAQGVGANLSGVVSDDTGGRLPGVTVTVRNTSNGADHVLTTGSGGDYRAVALQPGPYEVTAELAGFAAVKRLLTLTVGADAIIDFKLGLASVQETLTVTGEVPMVEVTKSQPTSVVTAEQLKSVPVLSRNFLELAQLLPGSGPDNARSQSFVVTKFGGVADQRNGFSTIFDGGAIDDSIWGSTLMNVSQEAVQEFRVFRNQFDAQYGAALQSVVTVITKSGGNKLSGSAFYFGRDRALSAKNAFATGKPPFSQNRVGGSLGGPFVANRAHFFGAYEYNKINKQVIIALPATNPLSATENGAFPSGPKNHMSNFKVDHRFNDKHSIFVRHAYDNQYILRERQPAADSNQTDESNHTNSVVGEESWVISDRMVNTFRVHYLSQNLQLLPHSQDVAISRPFGTIGTATNAPQGFPRSLVTASDAMYVSTPRHSLKFGGDFTYDREHHDSSYYSRGSFTFGTNAPFDANVPATWPISLQIKAPAQWDYQTKLISFYFQDDVRASDRLRFNLGVRYDIDTNMRDRAFFSDLLDNPAFKGLDKFISKDRTIDLSYIQPRGGITWDVNGNGKVVARGGFGRYVTRNRPWLDLTAQDLSASATAFVTDPQQLRFFPDINKVLGGSIQNYVASGGARLLYLIPDDYKLPYALNTTAGLAWQLTPNSSVTLDLVHVRGYDQLGSTDVNLPASGAISATNPRPVATFGQVGVLQNYSKSWYDGLETEYRRQFGSRANIQASYTLSRNYRDGVPFYSNWRGTQRTPDERGYSENDSRHNLTMSGTMPLPLGFQLSAVGKFISGSPFFVQAGFDMDGDGISSGDRPAGLPITVGRDKVAESVQIINVLRASRSLTSIDESLLKLDPFVSVDARVTKVIPLRDSRRLELYLEGYNLTNRVNYQPFTLNANINSRDFMVRNSARDPFQLQLGGRFAF
jgi:hypothetical protein